METMEKFADRLSLAAMWGGIIAGAMMMFHVVAEIIALKVLGKTLFGTIEIVSAYYMVALSYLPFAWIVKNEGHIFVELFTKGFSPRNLLRIDIFAMAVTILYVGVMAWKTLESAVEQTHIREQAESALGYIAVWPSRWFVVIGFGCFLLQLVSQFLVYWARLKQPRGSDASGGTTP